MSYPPDHSQYQYHQQPQHHPHASYEHVPLSASSASSSSTSSTLVSMNDVNDVKTMNPNYGGMNGFQYQQQQQQQFPGQPFQQQQQGGFRPPQQQQQAFAQQQQQFAQQQAQQQFAPLSHPGAMPNLSQPPPRPPTNPSTSQPPTPNPQNLQHIQNQVLQQHYQRQMQAQQQQQQQQKLSNVGQNLTPYQQQQMMLQYQQQRQQQQQQPGGGGGIQPQNTGGQQGGFIAPQHSGQSQPGALQPQHSGQQQQQQPMVNGFGGQMNGMGGGINPAMLAQQQQFTKQHQQQQHQLQHGMMNGLSSQIPRPGTAMGQQQQQNPQQNGMFSNNGQQQQQQFQPPHQQQQQQVVVPPSPALSAASQSQSRSMPPPMLSRSQSQSQHHQQQQMESPQDPTDAGRPMSRMSSSGGSASWNGGPGPQQQQQQPPQQQQAGQQMGAGVGGFPAAVDPRTMMGMNMNMNAARPQQQQQPPQIGMGMGMGMGMQGMGQQQLLQQQQQQQQQLQQQRPPGFGPASAATLQGHPPPPPALSHQQQQLPPQQQQQQPQPQPPPAFRQPQPGPLSNMPANAQQMAMLQRAHHHQQKQMPSLQEVFGQLNAQQQQQLLHLPQDQQQQHLHNLRMRMVREREMKAISALSAGSIPGAPQQQQQQQHQVVAPPQQQQQPPKPVVQQQQPPPPPPPPNALPAHLVGKVDARMLNVKPLPWVKDEDDVTHGGQLPVLEEWEIDRVVKWLEKDRAYIKLVEGNEAERRLRAQREAHDAAGAPRWFETDGSIGAGVQGQKLTVLWPNEKRKIRRGKVGRGENRFPLEYPPGETDTPEELVPIRLEVEFEQYRLRDTFVWNVNDPVVTVEKFAQTTCEDFQLPGAVAPLIAKQIQEQLSEYKAVDFPKHVAMFEVEDDPTVRGYLEDDEDRWWGKWKAKLYGGDGGDETDVEDDKEDLKPIDVKTLNEQAAEQGDVKPGPELRIMIKLDIMIGSKHLVDQFEWDMTESANSPEMFAAQYANELSLGGEFRTAIAHDIREQVSMYQRALIAVGHQFDGGTIFDDDLRQALLPPVTIAGRTADQASNCMPVLSIMSDGEIENNEKEREKELKRKKRQGRGRRGMVLPDREPLKTHRTLPGQADVAGLVPAAPAAVSVPSRRQAAVNASQTIASLVAQENNNGYPASSPMPSSSSVVATPTRGADGMLAPPGNGNGAGNGSNDKRASKRQKTGHASAPQLPDSVYRPRAKMEPNFAPPSTGVKPPPKTQERIQADHEAREHERAMMPEWHCSTCGCPDSIAVGRRKGPKGDKSQCGPCGKYYHRYRRTKDVEYNPDPAYHLGLRQQELERKKRKRPVKKTRTESSVAQDSGVNSPAPVDDDDDEDDDDDVPSTNRGRKEEKERPSTPPRRIARSLSSSPSPPLASTKKRERERTREKERHTTPPPTPTPTHQPPPPPPPAVQQPVIIQTPAPPPPVTIPTVQVIPPPPTPLPRPPMNPETPMWMQNCLAELQVRYKDDRFGPIIRPIQPNSQPGQPREWRIKCYDCPGKVYTPGPEETLSNFEVHLKNKRHRDNVNARLAKERAAGTPAGGDGPAVNGASQS